MSQTKRKLSYWTLGFSGDDNTDFDGKLLVSFIDKLAGMEEANRLLNYAEVSKAVSLDTAAGKEINGLRVYRMRFKSCKYNHSPNYMSSKDGSERASGKAMHEGEKEVTHLCVRIEPREAVCVVEERRSGMSFQAIVEYLNRKLQDYLAEQKLEKVSLVSKMICGGDFLSEVKKTNRITLADLYIDRKLLGSTFFDLLELDDTAREEIIVTVKARPKESLGKNFCQKVFETFVTSGTKAGRVRLEGKDSRNVKVIIDSLYNKKNEEITVELEQNGIVNSASIFEKMEKVLEGI